MSDDNDLEKRAIEELLRETSRARARVETMGPSGWMKCPLRSTNKRFLVNTLRSSGLRRRSDGPAAAAAPAATGCLTRDSRPGEEQRDRTPPKHSSPRGPAHSSQGDPERHLIRTHRRCEEEDGHHRVHSHKDCNGSRDRRPAEDTQTQGLHCAHASSSSSKGPSPPRERSGGSQSGRTRSRSPARGSQSGRSQK